MSDQAQLICYSHTKIIFHASTHAQDIGLSAVLECDWSRAPGSITQDLEVCQSWNLEWETKYHNKFFFQTALRKVK